MGTFGISKDVTRENRLKRESLLNARLAAIGQAVTGIHHSMKNMLSSLKGGSYLIETALEEDDKALLEEGWTMVQEGITHITNLSSLMLNYVRELQPELEKTDVGKLVKSVYVTTREMAQNKGISLQLDVERDTPGRGARRQSAAHGAGEVPQAALRTHARGRVHLAASPRRQQARSGRGGIRRRRPHSAREGGAREYRQAHRAARAA